MTIYIVSSGTTSDLKVHHGSVMSVFVTGIAKDIEVTSGGVISAYDGGVTSGSVLSTSYRGTPATEYVYSGGTSYQTVEKNGVEIVSGGTAYGTELHSGSTLRIIGGLASGTSADFGIISVASGTVSATTLTNEGILVVDKGGNAINTVVSGGTDVVSAGATTTGTMVTNGAEEIDGGTAYDTTLRGGYFNESLIYSGEAVSTTVSRGGLEYVYSAAKSLDTTITTGGFEYVYTGATESGTKINGGTLVLDKGKAVGAIKFSGSGGELVISSAAMPNGGIQGFIAGDSIELAAVSYASSDSVTVNAPGVVTVSAGGKDYNLKIKDAVVGEKGFVFGPGSLLTKTEPAQMAFLTPPVSSSAGFGNAWSALTPNGKLTVSDFLPKISGGHEVLVSSSHFGGLHSQDIPSIPSFMPVSITSVT